TFAASFFGDGPVRIHDKVVSRPNETYENFTANKEKLRATNEALAVQARNTEDVMNELKEQMAANQDLARTVKILEFGMILFAVLAFFIVYGSDSDEASRRAGLLN
ncbi:hypothetical protein AAVH_32183, partial [Aphelenchoides avenae]